MDDYRIMMCKQHLIEIINNAQLPASVVGYILKDIQQEVEKIVNANIQQAQNSEEAKEKTLNTSKENDKEEEKE